jgi:hypothetical protein
MYKVLLLQEIIVFLVAVKLRGTISMGLPLVKEKEP